MGCCESQNSSFDKECEFRQTERLRTRVRQITKFSCRIANLTDLHNSLCHSQDLGKPELVVLLDASQTTPRVEFSSISFDRLSDSGDSPLGLYRCKRASLNELLDNEASIDRFRRFIKAKHVFLLGMSPELMESETVDRFIQALAQG